MRFIITTSRTPGARLSRPGHWGNQPFADVAAAEAAARKLAGGAPFTIEHERGRR